jgi:hypothetical protein
MCGGVGAPRGSARASFAAALDTADATVADHEAGRARSCRALVIVLVTAVAQDERPGRGAGLDCAEETLVTEITLAAAAAGSNLAVWVEWAELELDKGNIGSAVTALPPVNGPAAVA